MNKVKLSEIANIKMGQSPQGNTCNENGDGIPLLNGPTEFTEFYPTPKQYTNDPKRLSEAGEILFCVRGSTTGRMNWSDRTYALGRGLASLSHKKGKKLNHFLKYLIHQNLDSILKTTNGSTFPNLTSEMLTSFKLIVPDLPIQQKIAAFFSALDSKIELNNRINRELEQMAKLLYDYWFVQFDFPFDFAQGKPYKTSGGKMVWNEELKREIPEGWKVKNLAQVTTSIMRGISPKYLDEEGICVLNQKCIRDQEVKFQFSRRHDHELKSASSKLIQYGDVLVNSTGFGTLGRVAIVKWLQEQTTAVDSHITIVRCLNESIMKLFLGYSMLGRQSEIEGLAEGSTGQTELSRVNLGQLKMIIPPIELQSRFEKFSEPLIQKMAVNEAENQQLASLRDWLLPMLMNGQVTVGAKEKVNYEVTEKMDVAAEPERN